MTHIQLDLRDRAQMPTLDVPPALTDAVMATWRGRMINEYRSSYVFSGLERQLSALGQREAAARCAVFAEEERTHGALCGAVLTAAGGAAVAQIEAPPALPAHADTTPRAAVLRNLVSICCMSETVAVALIGAERLEMPEGPLRALLSRIWADEIGHARFGWEMLAELLPSCDDAERSAIARYLPVALAHLESHEIAHIPLRTWPEGSAAYGLCNGADARTLLFETIAEVIIPTLAAAGLPAERAWQERRAP